MNEPQLVAHERASAEADIETELRHRGYDEHLAAALIGVSKSAVLYTDAAPIHQALQLDDISKGRAVALRYAIRVRLADAMEALAALAMAAPAANVHPWIGLLAVLLFLKRLRASMTVDVSERGCRAAWALWRIRAAAAENRHSPNLTLPNILAVLNHELRSRALSQTTEGELRAGIQELENLGLVNEVAHDEWEVIDVIEVNRATPALKTVAFEKELLPAGVESRLTVFIASVPDDDVWLRRVCTHLSPLARHDMIELWDNSSTKPGADENEELEVALVNARVAILLLSADFFAADTVSNMILPRLLDAAGRKSVRLLPLVVRPCLITHESRLLKYRFINSPDRPLSGLSRAEAEIVLVKLANALIDEYNDAHSRPTRH